MNCRKVKKRMPFFLASHESWLNPHDKAEIELHLACCASCRQIFKESQQAVEFLQSHWRISEDTQALIDQTPKQGKTHRNTRVSLAKATSVAAVIVICLGLGWKWLSNEIVRLEETVYSGGPKITVTENGIVVPTNDLVSTGQDIRELIINNKHRLIINRNTKLRINTLVNSVGFGCLVDLYTGEILTHVDHDGNPFEVHTPNSKAVITGTIFDIAVEDQITTLVVSEGSVRFESKNESVQVTAGTKSVVLVAEPPSIAVPCQTDQLMAWAISPFGTVDVSPEKEEVFADPLDELGVIPNISAKSIDLESLEYDQCVISKREWFEVQFPWIFEIQAALAEEGIEVSYPDLLTGSGDIWQIVYPQQGFQVVPVFDPGSFMNLAAKFKLDKAHVSNVVVSVGLSYLKQEGMFFGIEALEKMLTECRKPLNTCDGNKECPYGYSQAVAEYLGNTKTLLWLCIQNGKLNIPAEAKTKLLNLLHRQVTAACTCRNAAVCLSILEIEDCSDYDEHVYRIIAAIEEIRDCEKKIVGYRSHLPITSDYED